jgi:hypothetical protein
MNITEAVSYCGIMCTNCPIYWATQEENPTTKKKMRNKIAQICNEKYGLSYTYLNITDCEGCRSQSGRLFSGCVNCQVKKCSIEKNYKSCAQCSKYVYPTLQKIYDTDSSGKIWLDIIKTIM